MAAAPLGAAACWMMADTLILALFQEVIPSGRTASRFWSDAGLCRGHRCGAVADLMGKEHSSGCGDAGGLPHWAAGWTAACRCPVSLEGAVQGFSPVDPVGPLLSVGQGNAGEPGGFRVEGDEVLPVYFGDGLFPQAEDRQFHLLHRRVEQIGDIYGGLLRVKRFDGGAPGPKQLGWGFPGENLRKLSVDRGQQGDGAQGDGIGSEGEGL